MTMFSKFGDPDAIDHTSASDSIDLMAVASALWRGKHWLITGIFLGMLIGGYYAFFVATPTFKARALVEFTPQQNAVVDIQSLVSGTTTDTASLNTEIESIRMHEMIEKLVLRLSLTEDPQFNRALLGDDARSLRDKIKDLLGLSQETAPLTPDQQAKSEMRATIDRVRDNISATTLSDTHILKITARAHNPRLAAELANALAEIYIEDQLEAKFDAAQHAIVWLTDRAKELEDDVRQQENQINALRATSDLTTSDALEVLNIQSKDFRDLLVVKEQTLTTLRSRLAEMQRVASAQNKVEIQTVFDDALLSRALVGLPDDLTGGLPDAAAARIATLIDQAERRVKKSAAEVETIYASLEKLQARAATQASELQNLQQMQRKLGVTQDLYKTFLTGLQEATVQIGLIKADTHLASRARAPLGADSPNKTLIVAFSIFAGALIGAMIVLLQNRRGEGIRFAADIRKISDLPVLGEIVVAPVKARRKLLEYIVQNPTSALVECIRNLRTSIIVSNPNYAPRVIAFTSSVPGEGKSIMALSFAHNLTGLNKKVLVIEGDIRRSIFRKYMPNSEEAHSIVDVLSGSCKPNRAIQTNKFVGVDILFGGESKSNPADLFSSSEFENLLDQMREVYDYIIIDTPPVLAVPDARIISMYVDSLIYVVKWDGVSLNQLETGVELLTMAEAPIAGFTICQVDPKKIKRYGYENKYSTYSTCGKPY